MKKITLLAAAILLVGSSACGYAQTKGSTGTSRGASEYSPGDQMRDKGGPTKGSRGASEYSPGDQMKIRAQPAAVHRNIHQATKKTTRVRDRRVSRSIEQRPGLSAGALS
jgi:hypothetical protein